MTAAPISSTSRLRRVLVHGFQDLQERALNIVEHSWLIAS
jgi:hypothetical protein